jgi:hypothetical protein
MLGGKLTIDGVSVGLSKRLAVSVNKSIANVREPENRNADFTKTMKIPATPEVNALFEWAYEVNIDFQTFNPNKSTPGSYFLDTTEVIRGNIQLLSIPQIYNRGFYEIVIRGTNADLFIEMEGLFLTDLNFNSGAGSLNHALNYTNFSAAPTIGVGYCYGYIDYGVNGVNGYNWNVLHMKAAIWLKEYIDRIFALVGRTYTSTFLNSTFFKSIAMPCNKAGMYQYSPTQIANRQFYANKTATQTVAMGLLVTGTLAGVTYGFASGTVNTTTTITDDSTPPFNDPGAVYNTGTSQYTVLAESNNKVFFNLNYTLLYTACPATSATVEIVQSICTVAIWRNGIQVAIASNVITNTILTVTSGSASISTSISVNYTTPITDPIGTNYLCKIVSVDTNHYYKDAGNTILSSGSPAVNCRLDTGSTFYNLLQNQNLNWGDTIDMNTVVPTDVKMTDFFIWICRKFNLYFEIDKQNPLNYVIERRDAFFTTSNPLDINQLWDTSKEFTVLPMGELDAKRYYFKDKPDEDYWNKLYQDKYKETYGQQRIDVDNDFLSNDKIIETGFSPSPAVAFQTDIIAPRLLQIDGSFPSGSYTVKPIKTNPRLLYWGGSKNCNLHNLVTSISSGFVPISTFPSLNHIDDAASPTVDLNFSAPYEVFYQKPSQVWTTNTQYNVGYKKFITEITDPNSRIIQVYAMLTQDQIYSFTFRRLVYWKGSLFYVNSFENDDIQSGGATLLELLKLTPAQATTIVQYDPYNPPSGTNRTAFTNSEYTDRNNLGKYDNLTVGRNLNNGADIGILVGENIQVDRAITRFSAIGAKAKIIGKEYEGQLMLCDDAIVISDSGFEKIKTARSANRIANFTVVKPLEVIDATSGNVDFILPSATLLQDFTVMRIDNSGNVVTGVGVLGTELIQTNGVSATSNVVPTRTTRTYRSDGTNWYY